LSEDRIIDLDAADLSPGLRAELDRLLVAIFGGGSDPDRVWAPVTYHFLLGPSVAADHS
jgi:hypothetical protein